jgi:hypothetical protein
VVAGKWGCVEDEQGEKRVYRISRDGMGGEGKRKEEVVI